MNPEDDPEARIRALEQPLSDAARASEMGVDHQYSSGYGATPPPPPLPPPVQQWQYGGDPGANPGASFGVGYGANMGANPYPAGYPTGFPAKKSGSGMRIWMLAIPLAIVLLATAGGIVAWMTYSKATSAFENIPGISGGGGVITAVPPGIPSTAIDVPNGAPSQSAPQPGSTVSISGIGSTKTITCNDNVVVVSGANNSVTITGNCTSVTVSGFENKVVLDSAGAITAAGFNNHVTFRSGSPDITKSGDGNTVEQG